MDDLRIGSIVRLLRHRRGWSQATLATRAGLSRATVSRIERGHLGSLTLDTLRAVGAALDLRIGIVGRWRGGDLDRMLARRHSLLHEVVARRFEARWPAWILAPEVSFAIYAERGAIDILAWHPQRRALLVIELKTEVVDVNELLATVDRKRRLAAIVARERGWEAAVVSVWVIIAESRTNRRRIAEHRTMLRAALPAGARRMHRWLADPEGAVSALSLWPDAHRGNARPSLSPVKRVGGGRDMAASGEKAAT